MYSDKVEYREFGYSGIDGLLWPTSDTDAFSAILNDWKLDSTHWIDNVDTKHTVVQAGGNCGMYPLLYSLHFETVYTFEPDPLNFHCLVNNCQTDNIIKFNTALGNGGFVKLIHYEDHNIGTMKTKKSKSAIIPAMRLDSLNLEHCDLIHFDLEGGESGALDGSLDTIKKHKPIIVLEKGRGGKILSKFGYECIYNGRDTVYQYVDGK